MIDCEFDRRRFLQWTGAGVFAAMSTQLSFEYLASAASDSPLPAQHAHSRHRDSLRRQRRPQHGGSLHRFDVPERPVEHRLVGVRGSAVQRLLGFNSSMPSINALYGQNNVAIVQGMSYPNPSLSHFSSMAIWQSASLTAT